MFITPNPKGSFKKKEPPVFEQFLLLSKHDFTPLSPKGERLT
jgi:hypothetical protein